MSKKKEKKEKELPTNITAEESLLGCILITPNSFWEVYERVRADHFTAPIRRDIYTAIHDISIEGKKLSISALQSRLPEEDEEGKSTLGIITALIHNAQGLNAFDFADDVAEAAGRREIIRIGEQLVKSGMRGEKPAIDVASEAETKILEVMQATSPKRPRLLGEIAKVVVSQSFTSADGGRLPGYDTGLPALDEITGLLLPSDLIFLIGSQGDGKSALAAQMLMHISKSGPVLLLQNEMTEEQAAARQLATSCGIPAREIREGNLDIWKRERLKKAEAELQMPRFYVMSHAKMTVRQIRAHALAMKRSVGLAALCVDQLTHVRTDARTRDKFERLQDVTSEFKSIALEIDAPFICLAQRTRRAQRAEDATPQIDDADAPSIERDGDLVLAVWRMENWLRRNKPNASAGEGAMNDWQVKLEQARGIAEVIALKTRSGQAYEQRKLRWDGKTTKFSPL